MTKTEDDGRWGSMQIWVMEDEPTNAKPRDIWVRYDEYEGYLIYRHRKINNGIIIPFDNKMLFFIGALWLIIYIVLKFI